MRHLQAVVTVPSLRMLSECIKGLVLCAVKAVADESRPISIQQATAVLGSCACASAPHLPSWGALLAMMRNAIALASLQVLAHMCSEEESTNESVRYSYKMKCTQRICALSAFDILLHSLQEIGCAQRVLCALLASAGIPCACACVRKIQSFKT